MPTDAQIQSLRGLIRNDDKVYRHCDLQAERICPCLTKDYVESIFKKDLIKQDKQNNLILESQLNYLKQTLLNLLRKLSIN